MSKKGRPNQRKKAIKLSLSETLIGSLRASNVNISTLVENLLVQHFSLYSTRGISNENSLITRRSLVQIQPSLSNEKGSSREEPGDIINSVVK